MTYRLFSLHRVSCHDTAGRDAYDGSHRRESLPTGCVHDRKPGHRPGSGEKSTVHKDLSQRLPQYNKALYEQVKVILDTNKAQRHIRGGLATRKKYKGE